MSMDTHVLAISPPDDKWNKMRAAYESCCIAGVSPPEEVKKYFDYEVPFIAGRSADITRAHRAVTPYSEEGKSGFDVDLTKLPSDVKIIRFYNSW